MLIGNIGGTKTAMEVGKKTTPGPPEKNCPRNPNIGFSYFIPQLLRNSAQFLSFCHFTHLEKDVPPSHHAAKNSRKKTEYPGVKSAMVNYSGRIFSFMPQPPKFQILIFALFFPVFLFLFHCSVGCKRLQ